MTPARLAVFASGEGQTLEALVQACATGELNAQIVLVVGNRSQSGAAQRAQRHGVRFEHLSAVTHPNDDARDAAMHAALRASAVEWIVLAGYLKPLGTQVLTTWRGRIVNTHPSLLPRFGGEGMYGRHVHDAVMASGVEVTGASVHFVTEVYDTGPVIAQIETPVASTDTAESIETRVKALEQALLVRVLRDRLATAPIDLQELACPAGYVVQPAMPRHLTQLAAIESAAEQLFPAGRLGTAAGATRPLALLERAQAEGLLWVALTLDDAPVGFAFAFADGRHLHLQEMDVHPAHGRRGLGAVLLRYVCVEAQRRGYSGVTLTSFADLPWNAPFYAQHGFRVLTPGECTPLQQRILGEEAAKGIEQRVAMRRAFD